MIDSLRNNTFGSAGFRRKYTICATLASRYFQLMAGKKRMAHGDIFLEHRNKKNRPVHHAP